jgi:hypothetical protein
LLSGKHDNLHQVALELHQRGLTDRVLHATTLSRHAKAQALADGCPIIAKRGKPAKALSAQNRAARMSFCKANKRTNWGNIMFTDRKRFLFSDPGCSVKQVQWLRRGLARVANRPNKPSVVNMYAGITKHGVTKAHMVTGTSNLKTAYKNRKGEAARNITSAEYSDIMSNMLLPEGRRLFSRAGLSNWVFQQDNDPAHKRAAPEAMRAWNSVGRGRVELLKNWPPNSPDLSPIENAWALVQAKVDAAGCKTFSEFKSRLLDTWENIPRDVIKRLMASLPRRMSECMANGGDKTHF